MFGNFIIILLLNHYWIEEETMCEIKKYLEPNDNEKTC